MTEKTPIKPVPKCPKCKKILLHCKCEDSALKK